MVFTPKDKHSTEQKKEFNQFIRLNAHKLRTLGNFAITYLLSNPKVLFKPKIEDISWEEAAKEVITKFYERGGLPRPKWLDSTLTEYDENTQEDQYEVDAINNAAGAVRAFLLNHFNETYNKYARTLLPKPIQDSFDRSIDPSYVDKPLFDRIDFCIDNESTPQMAN